MLLDLGEGAVDGVVVGDVALDAEQPVGSAGSAVGDRHLVSVGGQPLRDGQTDAPVTAGDQDGAGDEGGRPPTFGRGMPRQPIVSPLTWPKSAARSLSRAVDG